MGSLVLAQRHIGSHLSHILDGAANAIIGIVDGITWSTQLETHDELVVAKPFYTAVDFHSAQRIQVLSRRRETGSDGLVGVKVRLVVAEMGMDDRTAQSL